MNYKYLGYALDFVSFLFEKFGKDADKINQVILFGSVTRGEFGKNSDIDLFIETEEKFNDKLNKIRDEFYESVKVKKYWSLIDIKNQINLSVGKLADWGDLQRSIIANGIILYAKYQKKAKSEHYYLFVVSPGKNRNKNLSIWRELYGYTQKVGKKSYVKEGFVKEYRGEKLARGVFTIPVIHAQKMILYLREKKFGFKVIPIWSDAEL